MILDEKEYQKRRQNRLHKKLVAMTLSRFPPEVLLQAQREGWTSSKILAYTPPDRPTRE